MDLQEYYEKFNSLHKVVDELQQSNHGSPFVDIICCEHNKDPATITPEEKISFISQVENRMLAMQLIMNADRDKYGSLIEDFDQDSLGGNNKFPKNPQDSYNLLKGWNKHRSFQKTPSRVELSFNTNGEKDGTALVYSGDNKKKCSRYGRDNHVDAYCVARKQLDGTMLHIMGSMEDADDDANAKVSKMQGVPNKFGPSPIVDFYCGDNIEELMMPQPHDFSLKEKQNVSSKTGIQETWILLDSQSTVDVFSNSDLLSKIHQTDTTLRIRCNAGMKTTNYQGYLTGYGLVWYYPDGIANIMSLSRVKDRYMVTFDSATDNCFRVHKDNGKTLKF